MDLVPIPDDERQAILESLAPCQPKDPEELFEVLSRVRFDLWSWRAQHPQPDETLAVQSAVRRIAETIGREALRLDGALNGESEFRTLLAYARWGDEDTEALLNLAARLIEATDNAEHLRATLPRKEGRPRAIAHQSVENDIGLIFQEVTGRRPGRHDSRGQRPGRAPGGPYFKDFLKAALGPDAAGFAPSDKAHKLRSVVVFRNGRSLYPKNKAKKRRLQKTRPKKL